MLDITKSWYLALNISSGTMTTKNMPQHSQIPLGDSTSPVENTSMVSSNSKWSTSSRAMWDQQLGLPRPSTWAGGRGGCWLGWGGAPGIERTVAPPGSHASTRVRSWTSKLCKFLFYIYIFNQGPSKKNNHKYFITEKKSEVYLVEVLEIRNRSTSPPLKCLT